MFDKHEILTKYADPITIINDLKQRFLENLKQS